MDLCPEASSHPRERGAGDPPTPDVLSLCGGAREQLLARWGPGELRELLAQLHLPVHVQLGGPGGQLVPSDRGDPGLHRRPIRCHQPRDYVCPHAFRSFILTENARVRHSYVPLVIPMPRTLFCTEYWALSRKLTKPEKQAPRAFLGSLARIGPGLFVFF